MSQINTEQIRLEIVERLGYFPSFFEPASSAPLVLRNLWEQTRDAYLDNPLPTLFKEKLAAVLSRYCSVSYCVMCHSSALRPLGMKAREILELLEKPALGFNELIERTNSHLYQPIAEDSWPEPGSDLEECLLYCSIALFVRQDSELCLEKLRYFLGQDRFSYFILFLGYMRSCLNWAEAHPELSPEADEGVIKHLGPLVEEEPGLRQFFMSYRGRHGIGSDLNCQAYGLTQQNKVLIQKESDARASAENQLSQIKSLLDSSAEGIWGLDLDGRITFVNEAALRHLAYDSADDMIGKNAHELVHGKFSEESYYHQSHCPIIRDLREGTSVHLENEVLCRADGTRFFADYRSTPVIFRGELSGAVISMTDNTERHQILDELKNSQEMLSGFFTQAPIPMAILLGPEHRFSMVNPSYIDFFKKHPIGRPFKDVFSNDDAARFLALLDEVYCTGEPYIGRELLFRRPDATGGLQDKFISVAYYPFRESDGRIKGILAFAIDQTEQVLARNHIEESESRLSTLAESVPASLMVFKPDATLEFANRTFLEYFGIRSELINEQKWSNFVHPDDGLTVVKDLHAHLDAGLCWISECRLRRKDGQYRWQLVRIVPHMDSDGQIVKWYGSNTDIHDQKTQAEELISTQSKLQFALESAKMGSWCMDLASQATNYSKAARTILGIDTPIVDAAEFIKNNVHPDDQLKAQETLAEAVEKRGSFLLKVRLCKPSGEIVWIISHGKLLFGADGVPYALTGIVIDLTEQKRTEALLRDSDARYRTLFESVDQGVCLLEIIFDESSKPVDYRFLEINPRFEAQTGLKNAQGKTARELVPDLDESWFEIYGRVALSGEPIRFEQEASAMNKIFDVYAVRVGEAEQHQVALLFSDISERRSQEKSLKESEARFRTITEVMPQIVWTALPNGKFSYFNPKWLEFSGLPSDTKLEEGWASSLHPDDRQRAGEIWNQMLEKGQTYQNEFRLRHRSGHYHWGLMRAVPVISEDGFISEWMGTWTDIHDQKLTAEELAQAKDIAEVANAAKSTFLANMSHEIRTPLAAIIGFSELLRDSRLGFEDREKYLQTIIRNGLGLTRIIDDILDLAKVEAGKLTIESLQFSLMDLINDVLEIFKDKAKEKGIYLLSGKQIHVPPLIVSDPARLRQILINLIGNAIKFTTQGGVEVAVSSKNYDSKHILLEIAVKDSGIGLSDKQQEKLFQPFVQADSTTSRKFGGTGLGLSLSKRLAQALGGDISIRDCKERQGCTFVLSFLGEVPLASARSFGKEPSPLVPAHPAIHETGNQKQRLFRVQILLADDSIDNQHLARRLLEKHGATVEIAKDGREAIQMALTNKFDVVLMDIQMPHVDGYEATRTLRSNGYKKPIIALTAHAMAEERERTKAAGCDGHLTKPLSQSELLKAIEFHHQLGT